MTKYGTAKVTVTFKNHYYKSARCRLRMQSISVTWELATLLGIISYALFPIPICFWSVHHFIFHTITGHYHCIKQKVHISQNVEICCCYWAKKMFEGLSPSSTY